MIEVVGAIDLVEETMVADAKEKGDDEAVEKKKFLNLHTCAKHLKLVLSYHIYPELINPCHIYPKKISDLPLFGINMVWVYHFWVNVARVH